MDKKADGIHETVQYHPQSSFLFHHNFSDHTYPNHWHNAVEIIMPIENIYYVDINNQSYRLNEYDILIIPSGELHELRSPKTKGQRIILQFSLETLNAVRGFINASYIYAKPLLITPKDGPELHGFIKNLLNEMLEEHLNRHIYYEVSITNKIISITLQLTRRCKDGADAHNENFIKRKEHLVKFNECLDFIHHHYKENLTLDMAAHATGFSKYHFARWFRQLADLSFSDYLAKTRIMKAESMLIGTSLPVTEIALDAGFQSASTFNRIFKEHKKCTPTEYRNFHYQNHNQKQQAASTDGDQVRNESTKTKMLTIKTLRPGGMGGMGGFYGTATNPVIWADVPDPDVIRVDNVYYMISTTMYFNPGIPVMRSIDLIHWEIINYVYDILDDRDACALRNGSSAYGKGSWAGSIRHHRGVFYVAVASFTTQRTYIFQTTDIESGCWHRYVLDEVYHDSSLLFDDDDRVYLVYGGGTIRVIELTANATAVKPGGLQRIIIEKANVGGDSGLPAEGAHLYKRNGKYYLFLIAWPKTGSAQRIELCYRADHIEGPYEGRVVLDDDMGYKRQGVAQGGIVDTPDGHWYAMLFQDHGAVGRVPVLVPVTWTEDGWPVFGIAGKVPPKLPMPMVATPVTCKNENTNLNMPQRNSVNLKINTHCRIVAPDEFYIAENATRDFGAMNDVGYRYRHMPDHVSDIFVKNEDVELIENGHFTNGTAHWESIEIAKLAVVAITENMGTAKTQTQSDTRALYVSGRGTTSSSPSQDITGKVVRGGVYKAYARVKYHDGPPKKDFNICIRNGKTWEGIQVMGSGQLYKGEWGEIRGTYTLPEDADLSETVVFIETPWSHQPKRDMDLMDFYVASVSVKAKKQRKNITTIPGENDPPATGLGLMWQWNHNPNHHLWSLQARPGSLRLRAEYINTDLLDVRNTLTQRTFGPVCAGTTALDVSGMNDGDVAGLAALQELYGFVGVKKVNGDKYLIMVDGASGHAQEIESIPIWQNEVYLRVDCDFANADRAYFYYSLDELHWRSIGHFLPMRYTLTHFTGYRFALFYYATQIVGGYADFHYFRIGETLARHNEDLVLLNASFGGDTEIDGSINTEFEISIHLEALPVTTCDGLYFSMPIPDCLDVLDVAFCLDNIDTTKGNTTYTFKNRQLRLAVTGRTIDCATDCTAACETNRTIDCKTDLCNAAQVSGTVSFVNRSSDLFALLRFRVNDYATKDRIIHLQPDYVYVDGANAAYRTHDMRIAVKQKALVTNATAKKPGYANPLIDYTFGGEPWAMEHGDRLYVYLTADQYEYNDHGRLIQNTYDNINTFRVISSSDLINWTYHPEINVAGQRGAAPWASHSWAPAVARKYVAGKERFYLYFTNDASTIGVLTADSPVGPWRDPIDGPLIHRGTSGVDQEGGCFDPAVLVDDDGNAYLYFGGGSLSRSLTQKKAQELTKVQIKAQTEKRQVEKKQTEKKRSYTYDVLHPNDIRHPRTAWVIRLGDDMISTLGEAVTIDAPAFFGDSGIHKYKGRYYYSYCSSAVDHLPRGYPQHGDIAYMISDHPMGPFTYAGIVLKNPQAFFDAGGNNHHCIFTFREQWYIAYHAQTLDRTLHRAYDYRSPHINELAYFSDGHIRPVAANMKGISRVSNVPGSSNASLPLIINPYENVEAATFAWSAGVTVANGDNMTPAPMTNTPIATTYVTDIQDGDWLAVAHVDFGKTGAHTFSAKVASKTGCEIEIRLNNPQGMLLGVLGVNATGSFQTWRTYTCAVKPITGMYPVFFVFKGDYNGYLLDIRHWVFGSSQN